VLKDMLAWVFCSEHNSPWEHVTARILCPLNSFGICCFASADWRDRLIVIRAADLPVGSVCAGHHSLHPARSRRSKLRLEAQVGRRALQESINRQKTAVL
jgi:hypothetical protein